MLPKFSIEELVKGKNSIFFRINDDTLILYEKLTNSIHSGNKEDILRIFELSESISYSPFFEGETLKNRCSEKLESLLLNVTETCDLDCSYCIYSGNYEGERVHNNAKMSFETARKAVDLFVPYSKEHAMIGFYGGEPLTNFDLIREVIKYAKTTYPDKSFVFSMTSNFFNAERYLEEIVKKQIIVHASLDGPKYVHDKYRKTRNGVPTFDKVIDNLEKLRKISPEYVKTSVGLNGTYWDKQDFEDVVDYFIKLDDDFAWLRAGVVERKGLMTNHQDTIDLKTFLKYAYIYASDVSIKTQPPKVLKNFFDPQLRNIFTRSQKQIPNRLMLNGCCYLGNRKLFVDTGGELYPCEKFGNRVQIGTVDSGIDHNHINQVIDTFTEIRNDYCRSKCWAQRLCNPCIQLAKDPREELSVEGLSEVCDKLESQLLVGLAIYVTLLNHDDHTLFRYCMELIN